MYFDLCMILQYVYFMVYKKWLVYMESITVLNMSRINALYFDYDPMYNEVECKPDKLSVVFT